MEKIRHYKVVVPFGWNIIGPPAVTVFSRRVSRKLDLNDLLSY